jgi:hypothetical protein
MFVKEDLDEFMQKQKCKVDLVSQETIDKDQAWFWTERWQKKETEAEEDIKKGRVKSFASVEELFDEIEESSETHKDRKVQKKRS